MEWNTTGLQDKILQYRQFNIDRRTSRKMAPFVITVKKAIVTCLNEEPESLTNVRVKLDFNKKCIIWAGIPLELNDKFFPRHLRDTENEHQFRFEDKNRTEFICIFELSNVSDCEFLRNELSKLASPNTPRLPMSPCRPPLSRGEVSPTWSGVGLMFPGINTSSSSSSLSTTSLEDPKECSSDPNLQD